MSLRLCKNMWECVYILYVYLHSLLIYCILHITVYIYIIILYVSFFLFFFLVASAPRQRNLLCISTPWGTLSAYDVKDGTLRWRVTTRRPPNNAPAVGKVYGWILGLEVMPIAMMELPQLKEPLLSNSGLKLSWNVFKDQQDQQDLMANMLIDQVN